MTVRNIDQNEAKGRACVERLVRCVKLSLIVRSTSIIA